MVGRGDACYLRRRQAGRRYLETHRCLTAARQCAPSVGAAGVRSCRRIHHLRGETQSQCRFSNEASRQTRPRRNRRGSRCSLEELLTGKKKGPHVGQADYLFRARQHSRRAIFCRGGQSLRAGERAGIGTRNSDGVVAAGYPRLAECSVLRGTMLVQVRITDLSHEHDWRFHAVISEQRRNRPADHHERHAWRRWRSSIGKWAKARR